MIKEYWLCKHCGHYEEIGKERADVIIGLCPKCYYFMSRQECDEEHLKKANRFRAQRVIHGGK